MGGFVYLMMNKNHTNLYCGVTSNLPQRVWQHQNRFFPRCFTSRYNCFELMYYEWHDSIELAIAREKQVKDYSREKKETLITAVNPSWRDLSKEVLLDKDPLLARRF